MSLDEAAAAVAAHLGIIEEEKINNESYIWFNLVLEALGKRLNYESISNLYGNSFAKDSSKIVQAANPLIKNGGGRANSIMDLPAKVAIVNKSTKEEQKKAVEAKLGDLSWAEGLF